MPRLKDETFTETYCSLVDYSRHVMFCFGITWTT